MWNEAARAIWEAVAMDECLVVVVDAGGVAADLL